MSKPLPIEVRKRRQRQRRRRVLLSRNADTAWMCRRIRRIMDSGIIHFTRPSSWIVSDFGSLPTANEKPDV